MSRILKGIFILLTMFVHTTIMAQSVNENKILVDEIIGKVDDHIILRSELEFSYQSAVSNGGYSATLRCDILKGLLKQKLMVAKAEIDSVIVTAVEVENNLDQRMQIILQSTGGSVERLEKYYGKSIEQIREEIRDRIAEQLVIQRMQTHITSDITVTPAEVQRFFRKIPKDSLPLISTEVKIGQLVKNVTVSQEQKEQTIKKLNDLRSRALNGEDFRQLAKTFSEGPSANYGGDLGMVSRGNMVPAFEEAALELSAGEISAPVETEYGFHIIEMVERRGNEYHSRHILLKPVPSQEDIDRTTSFVDSIRNDVMAEKLTFERAVTLHSDDKATNTSGGYLKGPDGSIKISTEELDPVISINIDTLEVGKISPPMTFRTDDGKDAIRILYFKEKFQPHVANLEDDWIKIKDAALREKRDKAIEKWFEEAKFEVFIRIDEKFDSCKILEE